MQPSAHVTQGQSKAEQTDSRRYLADRRYGSGIAKNEDLPFGDHLMSRRHDANSRSYLLLKKPL